MDVKEIKEAVEKLAKDEATKEAFKKDPVHTIEQTFGVDLPDEQVKAVVAHVKEKFGEGDYLDKIKEKFSHIDFDKIKDEAGDLLEKAEEEGSGLVDKIKGLFHKD